MAHSIRVALMMSYGLNARVLAPPVRIQVGHLFLVIHCARALRISFTYFCLRCSCAERRQPTNPAKEQLQEPIRVPLAPLPTNKVDPAPASPPASTPLKQSNSRDAAPELAAAVATNTKPLLAEAKDMEKEVAHADAEKLPIALAEEKVVAAPQPVPDSQSKATMAAAIQPLSNDDNVIYQSKDRVRKVVIQRQPSVRPANPNANSKPSNQISSTVYQSARKPVSAAAAAHEDRQSKAIPKPKPAPVVPASVAPTKSTASASGAVGLANQKAASTQQLSTQPPESPVAPQTAPRQPIKSNVKKRKQRTVRFAADSSPKCTAKPAGDYNGLRKRDSLLALADQLDAEREASLAKRRKVRGRR